jgi:hypothetical protein
MWYHLSTLMDRFQPEPTLGAVGGPEHGPVVIRRARDSDMPLLHDLAELDAAAPLQGPVLVAVVDERVWAAIGVEDRRVIADPFRPSLAAVELLRLRVEQLHATARRAPRVARPRWLAGRARA